MLEGMMSETWSPLRENQDDFEGPALPSGLSRVEPVL